MGLSGKINFSGQVQAGGVSEENSYRKEYSITNGISEVSV